MSLRPRPIGVKLNNVPKCTWEDECPVCLELFYTNALDANERPTRLADGPYEITTNCGHVMHRRCFLSLIAAGDAPINRQCPTCKTPFADEEVNNGRAENQRRPPPALATLQRARGPAGVRPSSRAARRARLERPPSSLSDMEVGRGWVLPSLALLKR